MASSSQDQTPRPTGYFDEGHEDLRKQLELVTQELHSIRKRCDEYEKTILYQANEIRNLQECLSFNVCGQCKKESQEMELRSTVLGGNNPGSHVSLKSIASIFKPKSRTVPSSRSASTNRQAPNPLPSHIVPTAFSDKNIPFQSSQNLSLHDNDTNMVSQEQNWSIVFNRKVKKELDLKLIHTLLHREAVYRVRFSPEGKHLAVAYATKVDIYDVVTGRLICVLADLYDKWTFGIPIVDLRFSPDGRYLATTCLDRIYIWEISRKYVRNVLKHSKNHSLDFSSNGRLLVSLSYNGTVRVWNTRDGTSRVFSHGRGISSVVFSLDGLYVITGDADGMISMWNLRTGHSIKTVKAHNDSISSLALMPDGKGLVSGSWDKTSAYWDVGPLMTNQYLRPPSEDKVSLKVDDSEEPECQEINIKNLQRFIDHTGGVWTVAISPNKRWIVSSSDDKSVGIWDTQNAEMQCMLQARSSVFSTDVSPTGNYLAASCFDGQVGIWTYNKV